MSDATSGEETRHSRENREELEFCPDWTEYRFAALLRCNEPLCGEVVSICGYREGYDHPDPTPDGDYWAERLHIESVLPAPLPIHIPEKVPERIRIPIENAAKLYWVNRAAAANALRQAVERFLDYKGAKKTREAKAGKKGRRMSLGERFDDLHERLKGDVTFLSAIRWLGNVGSHQGNIDGEQVLTAFEMIEHVLEDQFVGHTKQLVKRAKRIERTRGKGKIII